MSPAGLSIWGRSSDKVAPGAGFRRRRADTSGEVRRPPGNQIRPPGEIGLTKPGDQPTHMQMRKRTLLAGAAVLGAAGLAAFFFNPTHAIRVALSDLRGADPGWLVAAGAAFLGASVASAF